MERHHGRKIVAFFADKEVGFEAVKFVLDTQRDQVQCIITVNENEISQLARSFDCPVFYGNEITEQTAEKILGQVDLIFLAWWPNLIPEYLIKIPRIGIVNFHPSLLPHNRGKHYNFWTIVEGTPFGVTLHFIDKGVDTGDIIFQSTIEKDWEDTGESLYRKAIHAIVSLFKERYIDIIEGRYNRIKQCRDTGITHYAKELDPACEISLDKQYTAKNLLNLLRARTFAGKPACYFRDADRKYEVRVSIKEIDDEPR